MKLAGAVRIQPEGIEPDTLRRPVGLDAERIGELAVGPGGVDVAGVATPAATRTSYPSGFATFGVVVSLGRVLEGRGTNVWQNGHLNPAVHLRPRT